MTRNGNKNQSVSLFDENGNKLRIDKSTFPDLVKKFRPNVKIMGEYITGDTKMKFKCLTHNLEFETTLRLLLINGQGCDECKKEHKHIALSKTHETFINEMKEKHPNIEVVKIHGEFANNDTLVTLKCKIHKNHEWTVSCLHAIRGTGCFECNKIVSRIKNGNNVSTLRPDLVKYFKNPEDADIYSAYNNVEVTLICPDCGKEKQARIDSLARNGFICTICGDGISYPNKVARNAILTFDNQFDYIRFEYYLKDKDKQYRYDIYFELNNQKYVVEIDGSIHNLGAFNRKAIGIQENDKRKDALAKNNNINLIRIPCPNDSLEEIKNGFEESILSTIFDLSLINWEEVDKISQKSLVKKVCDYFNEDEKIKYKDISIKLKIPVSTVGKYVRKGVKLGWVSKEYYEDYIRSRKNKYKNMEE